MPIKEAIMDFYSLADFVSSMWLYLLLVWSSQAVSRLSSAIDLDSGFNTEPNETKGKRNRNPLSIIETGCQFNWTNRYEMVMKVRDRMKNRNKLFLRFKVPVFYLNSNLTWQSTSNVVETWVWVPASHEYMLYFPHNFNVLSLGTMGIITKNFGKPGGEGNILGSCNNDCITNKQKSTNSTSRCSLTKKDLVNFMSDVIDDEKEWNYVCLQLDYVGTDVVSDPNSAVPDLLYYFIFLRKLFSRRPYFGKGMTKDDFINYNCFKKDGGLEIKELHMNYFVIFVTAVILWLYTPLLIHYFPSSELTVKNYPANLNHAMFHSTHKSPVYFTSLLRCMLCFYMKENKAIKSRTRRFLFVGCLLGLSIRFVYTAYWNVSAFFGVLIFFFVAISPDFWSVHLSNEHPTHFLDLWEYPEGVFRRNTQKKEYQFLAHCMSERIYLFCDIRFWKMLYNRCFTFFHNTIFWYSNQTEFPLCSLKLVHSLTTTIFIIFVALFYHLTPALYFYKQLFVVIFKATKQNLPKAESLFFSFIIISYFMAVMMFICYFVAEVTMFIYIGAVLEPSMAFKYLTLTSAIALLLYRLVKDLQDGYGKLRDEIVKILNNAKGRSQLNILCRSYGKDCTFDHEDGENGRFSILLKIKHEPSTLILYHDYFGTYLLRGLLDFCIEICDPLRRQVLMVVVKLLLTAFYIGIAMWIKNVFHKEKDVSSIFNAAQGIAITFVPNLFEFAAHKSHLGKKDDVVFSRRVHDAIAQYVAK